MKNTAIKLIFGLLALTLSNTVFAQDSQGSLAESWGMTIKQGQQGNFEAAFKAHGEIRDAAGDPRAWEVYTPVTGDQLNVYAVRTCCYTWADQDAYIKWERDNPGIMQDFFANVDQYVESYGHYFSEVDLDNSHWGDGSKPVVYVGVTEYAINPGHAAEFHSARAELSQIAINQGWGETNRWAWTDQVGGKPVSSLAVPFSSFADMGDDEQSFRSFVVEHAGEERTSELMEQLADSVKSSSYSIWAHRPDLSTGSGD
ncbi:MAG TPA: hypothetical protein VKN35_11495 [Xanthomonadales bacterium]|nr:hypothetical protein [Xanthomonadales bacterium]